MPHFLIEQNPLKRNLAPDLDPVDTVGIYVGIYVLHNVTRCVKRTTSILSGEILKAHGVLFAW